MNAEPSFRLAVAPRFRLSADWPRRLALGTPWRPPTDRELAALVGDAARPESEEVVLFALPRHLLDEWRELLERAAEHSGPLEGFDAFAGRVVAFLTFKGLPVPPDATFAAEAFAPGQETVLCDAAAGSPLWGGVNLGEEAAAAELTGLPDRHAPPVRLWLQPGEGFRLPDRGPVVTVRTPDREEPDLFLLVHLQGRLSP